MNPAPRTRVASGARSGPGRGAWRRIGARVPVLVALFGLALAPLAARADQTDGRLESLFARLAAAPDPAGAMPVEAEIWRVWLVSGDPGVDALVSRGVAAMSQGDIEGAIAWFDQVVERAPAFAEGWNKRATAYYLDDDLEASVADIRATLALEPRHFGALSGMGLIFLQTGDPRGALAAFEAVLAVHPQSLGARERVRVLRERLAPVGS